MHYNITNDEIIIARLPDIIILALPVVMIIISKR